MSESVETDGKQAHLGSEGLLSQGSGETREVFSGLGSVVHDNVADARPGGGHASKELIHKGPIEATTARSICLRETWRTCEAAERNIGDKITGL